VPPSLLEVASSQGFVATSFFSAYAVEHVNLPVVGRCPADSGAVEDIAVLIDAVAPNRSGDGDIRSPRLSMRAAL
jgi:hypothetical protein